MRAGRQAPPGLSAAPVGARGCGRGPRRARRCGASPPPAHLPPRGSSGLPSVFRQGPWPLSRRLCRPCLSLRAALSGPPGGFAPSGLALTRPPLLSAPSGLQRGVRGSPRRRFFPALLPGPGRSGARFGGRLFFAPRAGRFFLGFCRCGGGVLPPRPPPGGAVLAGAISRPLHCVAPVKGPGRCRGGCAALDRAALGARGRFALDNAFALLYTCSWFDRARCVQHQHW